MDVFLGIDVGSVSTKIAALDQNANLINHSYKPTLGDPVAALKTGLEYIKKKLPQDIYIRGVATTGSGRRLAGVICGADMVKNEITCQATAARHFFPEARTVIEIGGQDSKLIPIDDDGVTDFSMNTVCAAGTGSFLDSQAIRLGMSIEEFSRKALESGNPVSIAGRCTVFAESDMVHKQQMGHPPADIIYGLCRRLVRNYLGDMNLGRNIEVPLVFQGGVAFNEGIVRAFEEELDTKLIVPPHPEMMGAIGAALLARREMFNNRVPDESRFKGFESVARDYKTSPDKCRDCATPCSVTRLTLNGQAVARWGGACDLWQEYPAAKNEELLE